MRWVILSDDWPPQRGGVASWGFGAANGLVRAGCAVHVFARARDGLVAPAGVQLTAVRGRSFGSTGPWWTGLAAARALTDADAVLATTWPMARAVAPVLRAAGVPLHVVFHGSDLTRPVAEGAAAVVAGARCWAVSRFLVGQAAVRGIEARWIPSPVDAPTQVPGPRPEGPWVTIARATPLKGLDRFVALVAEAGAEGVVVGDGPARATAERAARERGAQVRFLGALDRQAVARVLTEAAVVALLPRVDRDGGGAEGLGLVLLEGAAAGALPVGCGTGGVPEAVGPGVLVDPDDPVSAAIRVRQALAAWAPEAGVRWLRETHGSARVAAALLGS